MSIELVTPSGHLILCPPRLLLTPIPPSIRVFSNESTLRIRWPTYWSFSFSISYSKEHPGLISFRMDWLDLHAVQGTLKSLLQHHTSKASILQCSAFFTVQLSHPHMTTGKTIALTRWTFVVKVISLLFNMLSTLVITFLTRSKRLLISWLQSPSAVILEPQKIKSDTVSTVKVKVKSLSHVQLFVTPRTVAYQAPPSMGFSRQEYWSGLPFSSPRDLPDPGIESGSPAFQADALTSEPPGKPLYIYTNGITKQALKRIK